MSDLSELLPTFDQKPWKHLTFSLEKKGITTSELIACDPKWLAKFVPLPLREVERMAKAVTRALHQETVTTKRTASSVTKHDADQLPPKKRQAFGKNNLFTAEIQFITTLDLAIDKFLGGGIPTGYVTEIVGESAAGKSQFVHALLLAATLKAPKGLGKTALYVTTEDDLMTTRLEQILYTNSTFKTMPDDDLPNLDRIFTIKINTLTEQESVLAHRLRPEIKRRNIGLVVIDSIAAHFRAHFGGNNPKVLAARAIELQNIGKALQQLAYEEKVAVVITNQVSDRFDDIRSIRERNKASLVHSKATLSDTEPGRSQMTDSASQVKRGNVLSLDHQQMFFTGWGDDLSNGNEMMKTPALGLAWTNQLDARIVLKVIENVGNTVSNPTLNVDSRSRFMKVVFAKWTPPSRLPLRYELRTEGVTAVTESYRTSRDEARNQQLSTMDEEDSKFLDPKYWEDDIDLDEESGRDNFILGF